ncbi:MAG: hypothetical protein IKR34_00725 [Candidatus Gastranaerophilales bacterium]|nr:hypothetical protein [Candidatus Gastranaerophilales bacterium]
MITLTIIGVISAIVVPIAVNSRPDENVMKFKKAHNTLYQVINTLVTSDKYYSNGDLGIKADGTQIFTVDGDREYFCKTIADLISVKEVNCNTGTERRGYNGYLLSNEHPSHIATGSKVTRPVNEETILASKNKFDEFCKSSGKTFGAEITTVDGVVYYQSGSGQFGSHKIEPSEYNHLTTSYNLRYFSPPGQHPANYADELGNDISYKIFCIDVDGIPDDVTTTDCKNECPFGYGIRADGKIMNGKRADEWLEKDIQGES